MIRKILAFINMLLGVSSATVTGIFLYRYFVVASTINNMFVAVLGLIATLFFAVMTVRNLTR